MHEYAIIVQSVLFVIWSNLTQSTGFPTTLTALIKEKLMKILLLVRGVSGAGKTSFVKALSYMHYSSGAYEHYEADMYFMTILDDTVLIKIN